MSFLLKLDHFLGTKLHKSAKNWCAVNILYLFLLKSIYNSYILTDKISYYHYNNHNAYDLDKYSIIIIPIALDKNWIFQNSIFISFKNLKINIVNDYK